MRMKVLFVVPRAQFNYKAPWTPLGTISIATFIKQRGHTVRLTDQSFDKKSVKEHLDDFAPDAVCVSVISVRVAKDARRLSLLCKERGIPVIWGGFFSADYYKELLLAGMTDYITMGEGEFNTLHLLEALENGTPVRDVRGIAYLENGEPMLTEAQPLADLRDLPVLDFSLCDTENYIHPYLFCKRMMYVYASKGCPGNCAFCSNPTYHCHKYRVRPIDYVIREIKYLYTQYHIDGVYFSDECWYVRREMMQEFCRRLREEKIDIYWGCELRFGICSEEDYRMLYDSGCRWIMFGTESGDPEMLKTIRKHHRLPRRTARAAPEYDRSHQRHPVRRQRVQYFYACAEFGNVRCACTQQTVRAQVRSDAQQARADRRTLRLPVQYDPAARSARDPLVLHVERVYEKERQPGVKEVRDRRKRHQGNIRQSDAPRSERLFLGHLGRSERIRPDLLVFALLSCDQEKV